MDLQKKNFERTIVRDTSKKPQKANMHEVLFSVKGIRDVFFTPRVLRNGDSTHIKVRLLGSRFCINGSYCERCKNVHAGCLLCFLNETERKIMTANRLLLRLGGACLQSKAIEEAERRRLGDVVTDAASSF